MSNPLSILSTAGIQDPQTRAFLDRLMQVWGSNFVSARDVQRSTVDAISQAISGARPGGPPAVSSDIMQSIDNLVASIRGSLVKQILEQKITLPALEGLRNEVQAGMRSETNTRTTSDRSLASAINRIWAYIGGSTALIEQGTLADVTPSAAVADKWNSVVAAVTDPDTGAVSSAAILEETRAFADNANDTFNAIYSVKAQIAAGGATVVGGFALAATAGAGSPQGPTIDFGVLANKFFIAAPSGGGYDPAVEYTVNDGVPFVVVTTPTVINGVSYAPGVYMKSLVVGDAAIDNAKLGRYIKSDSFDGTIDGSGNITSDGTVGWAIDKTGRAVFNNVRVRKIVDSNSGEVIPSVASTAFQGDAPDTGFFDGVNWVPAPWTHSNLRIYGADYHALAPFNQRARYSPDPSYPILVNVFVTGIVDTYLTLWMRNTGGTWSKLWSSESAGISGDGFASVIHTLSLSLPANEYIDFGITSTRPDDTFFDTTKRYVNAMNFTINCVNV